MISDRVSSGFYRQMTGEMGGTISPRIVAVANKRLVTGF